MKKLTIICIDDQREVLSAIASDLNVFEPYCLIEECESADEAMELMEELDAEGKAIALLISDHIMPGKNGVEFLTEINQEHRFRHIKKILLTGLATHQDTIRAINNAGIDHYLEKPYKAQELQQAVKELVTQYILRTGLNYEEYPGLMDQDTLLKEMRNKIQ
ncbi:response regulator [Rapidithrix thailandica]|uniref:Response regulator n=1 Tax=Rapidithrix thailandica TaxID=413964 RepID=A0AAW9S6Z3_9BACT